ncbi:MAG: ABC transporter permease subunit [Phycisphaerae bacterium]|nr:ABC transporter permease subunit [Phycisphaerae bacterium]
MAGALSDFGRWFWRLVPANPIFLRVVLAGGRRDRHFWIRTGYLFVLGAVTILGVLLTHPGANASLAVLAKSATSVFKWVSLMQLFMICVIAPVFAAAAITQEKDSQTFNVLLSTPLSNAQIVLGSLLSRLYFVLVLLIAGIPLFCILMVYGGVTGDKIAQSIFLSAATALITSTLAIAISVIKIGTGRTIFSFYLAIATYLICVYALGIQDWFIPPESTPAPGQFSRMSWLAAFHPFLAMRVVLGETPAPDIGAVSHYGFPIKQLLAYPQYAFMTLSAIASVFLLAASLCFVRRGLKEGEPSFFSKLFRREPPESITPNERQPAEENAPNRGRKPRHVLRNPIAWRESVTGAAQGGGSLTRITLLAVGMASALLLVVLYANGAMSLIEVKAWLYTLVMIEVGIAFFIATTTAATSMTREKESNTLELVLATPLTSSQIIHGKIRGLVVAAGPLLFVPYASVVMFILRDLFAGRLFGASSEPVVHWEALITVPLLLVAFTLFACMIGLRASIRQKKTINAVFTAMAVVLMVFGGASICPFSTLSANADGGLIAAFMTITPVTAFGIVLDPVNAAFSGRTISAAELDKYRAIASIMSVVVAGTYLLIGASLHKNMVQSFDMTIRKQSA